MPERDSSSHRSGYAGGQLLAELAADRNFRELVAEDACIEVSEQMDDTALLAISLSSARFAQSTKSRNGSPTQALPDRSKHTPIPS